MQDPKVSIDAEAPLASMNSAAKSQPGREKVIAFFSFDALVNDEMVRLVMQSDHVSESDLRGLREIHPLIS